MHFLKGLVVKPSFRVLCMAAAYAATAAGAEKSPAAQQAAGLPSSDWRGVAAQLDAFSPTYTEPCAYGHPTLHHGAFLGNGDFGVHLGGTKNTLVYYLGKNGFHAGNDAAAERWTQHILNLARLTIEPGPAASPGDPSRRSFKVTQDLKNSEIRSLCIMGGCGVRARGFMAPDINAFVLELSTDSFRDVPLQATLAVNGNYYVALAAGAAGSVAWVTKEPNAEGAPFYVKGAVAARILGAESTLTTGEKTATHKLAGSGTAATEVKYVSEAWTKLAFTLPPSGRPVRILLHAEHSKNAPSPLTEVQAAVRGATDAECAGIQDRNRAWWKNFWLRSFIKLDDDVARYWYTHLYLMGSAARSGRDNGPGKAPGHWGPWVCGDGMAWFSNLGMNYNAQNPYYGTFAANHVSLIDPYIETIQYYAENTGRKRVANRWVSAHIAHRMPKNCRGVQFEGSFTSHGTSCGGGEWAVEDCGMASNAIFGILPAVWKWKYGQDRTYLEQTCYPLMLAVADFYDDFIGPPVDGRYDVYGAVHEGGGWFAKNDMFSLGGIRFLYREIIAASAVLGRDADRRVHWQDILDHMSEYPLQAWGNTITFRPDSVHDVMDALTHAGGPRNTGIMFTTTFDNIGHDTLPAYRIATCNTLDKGNMLCPRRFGGWQDSNDFGMMFVMAVRAGYPAARVIEAIKLWEPSPNGIVSQKMGGGIETAGIIEAINSMLLQGHDGVIRVFPNWDRTKDAEFKNLRTAGAFLVAATYRAAGQEVASVRISSEAGNRCVVQSPWAGACVAVTRADDQRAVSTVQIEDTFAFDTTPGMTYVITRQDCPPPAAGTPVITRQPADATLVVPATATFTVEATGKDVAYQWQKNRADIPGATAATYTTPATTMWDIGSEYRCVVTNTAGVARSRPGVIQVVGGARACDVMEDLIFPAAEFLKNHGQ